MIISQKNSNLLLDPLIRSLLIFQLIFAAPLSLIAAENPSVASNTTGSASASTLQGPDVAQDLEKLKTILTPEDQKSLRQYSGALTEFTNRWQNVETLPLQQRAQEMATQDPHKMRSQYVEVGGEIFRFGDPLAKSPPDVSYDFGLKPIDAHFDVGNGVRVEVDSESKTLSLVSYYRNLKGRETIRARHVFEGLAVVSYSVDNELLQVVTREGRVLAISMALARTAAFNAPLPVVHLLTLPEDIRTQVVSGQVKTYFVNRYERISYQFVHEGGVYPLNEKNLADQLELKVGDFAIEKEGRLLSILDRGISWGLISEVHASIALVASQQPQQGQKGARDASYFLLKQTSPNFIDLKEITSASQNEPVREQFSVAMNNPVLAKTLSMLPDQYIRQLSVTASNHQQQKLAAELGVLPSDRGSVEEFSATLQKMKREVTENIQDIKSEVSRRAADQAIKKEKWQQANEIMEEDREQQKNKWQWARDLVTRKALKSYAIWGSMGTVAFLGVPYVMENQLVPQFLTSWAEFLYSYYPDTVKEQMFRWPVLLGTASSAMLIPALFSAAWVVGKKIGWPAVKALAVGGVRFFGYLNYSLLLVTARLSKNPNFAEGIRLGVNPYQTVKPNSDLAEVVGGISQKMRIAQGRSKVDSAKNDKQDQLFKAEVRKRQMIRSVSEMLALHIVAHNYELPPIVLETVITAMRQGERVSSEYIDLLLKDLDKVMSDPRLEKKWKAANQELILGLSKTPYAGLHDLVETERGNEILVLYGAEAIKVAGLLKARGGKRPVWNRLKSWREELSPMKGLSALSNWGYTEYKRLKNVIPEKALVREWLRTQIMDFIIGPLISSTYSDRADFTQPESLAPIPSFFSDGKTEVTLSDGRTVLVPAGAFWMTKQAWADNFQQLLTHNLKAGAEAVLTHQPATIEKLGQAQYMDDRYQPYEETEVKRIQNENKREETFKQGINAWWYGLTNLKDAEYGYVFLRYYWQRLRTSQSLMAIDVSTKLFIGGTAMTALYNSFFGGGITPFVSAVGTAFLGSTYYVVGGLFAYIWIWIINRVVNIYNQRKLGRISDRITKVTASMKQGLRLDDLALVEEGYRELMRIFVEFKPEVSTNIQSALIDAEEKLNEREQNRISLKNLTQLGPAIGPLIKLLSALERNHPDDLALAYTELEQYMRETPGELKLLPIESNNPEELRDRARALIKLTLEHPPYPNSPNTKVWNLAILNAVIVSSVLGYDFMAQSYNRLGEMFSYRIYQHIGILAALFGLQKLVDTWYKPMDQLKEENPRMARYRELWENRRFLRSKKADSQSQLANEVLNQPTYFSRRENQKRPLIQFRILKNSAPALKTCQSLFN